MDGRALWRRWLVVVTAGELVGFGLPAVVGILARDAAPDIQLVVLPVAGLVEGLMLGLAQAAVLRRAWDAFRSAPWVVATSLAAAVAWFLGMLPSTTHDTWSAWPVAWVVVAAGILGSVLLGSIGAAQALALPSGTPGRVAWVAWTAAGWCAGLVAFTVVSTPLWQPGQPRWLLLLIGVAGGLAMALAMAAVTGVGAVRLVAQAIAAGLDPPFAPGQHLLSALVGTNVYDETGRRTGTVRDLVVDLATGSERPPVTHLQVRTRLGAVVLLPWADAMVRSGGDGLVIGRAQESRSTSVSGPTELFLRRDVLDSPVVTPEPPRRARVSNVLVDFGPDGAHLTGLDLSGTGLARRVLGRSTPPGRPMVLPLSQVHLVSRSGHAAQLAAPEPMVLGLPAGGMAEVLTRVPVSHARDIMRAVDDDVRDHAVRLLHPHVRARVTGTGGPVRRTRRLGGWRLHRPGVLPPRGGGR